MGVGVGGGSSELFAHLYAVSKDAVMAVNAKGHVTHFNLAAVNLFRVKEELALHDKFENFLVEAQREPFRGVLAKFFEKSEKKLAKTALEVTAQRGDGKILRCDLSLSSFQIGPETGVLALFRDVTERRATAQKLHDAQKMQLLDRLASEVAHDVNNLLMGIQGYAALIRQSVDAPARNQYLDETERLVKQGGELMKELRAFARTGAAAPSAGAARPVDINECLKNMRQVLIHTLSDKIVVEPSLEDGLPKIQGNLNQLEQAFMNICLNARDAMPTGGVLYLETARFSPDQAFLRTHPGLPAGELVKVRVRDTGAGMDPETLRRVFEPFFTTKEKQGGTGLGLTLAYKAVKEHGGYIWVDSRPGEGTSVELYFSAMASGQSKQETEAPETVVRGSGTILLIEDEAPVRETTAKLLESIGYTVWSAKTGDEGLAMFSSNPGGVGLALIDMKMPGKNGVETFQELKKIRSDVKAILTTGYTVRGDTDAMFRMGLGGYLLKPYSMAELSRKIDEILKEPAPPASAVLAPGADQWVDHLEKDAG